MRRITRLALGVLAAVGLTAGGTFGPTGPAAAAPNGCSGSGGSHTDYLGNTYGTTNCNVYSAGYVRNSGANSGYLYTGTSWFVCQEQWVGYENPSVGSARNNYWLYTQGDDGYAHSGWGWFPATKVSGGGNYAPVPGLRSCDGIPFFPFPTP
ncbi:hypothetical protein [Krasilnikovia sp. MM14-A1004]|uniref:hypothetical protein n=1 Tax=Krasilnikovia sp. MM14-A1004 TaxID=3373541 RepID=UPI00399D03CB